MPDEAIYGSRLVLCCRKCTREAAIFAPDLETAVKQAIAAGWVHDPWAASGREYVCPECPSSQRRPAVN